MTRQSRRVPIAQWLPRYDRSWLAPDVAAGLTLWGLVVPQGMAYAGIAGLPPEAGLYTLVASLLVYALLGTSRHLSVQPTSATAALIASTVVAVGVSSDDAGRYVATAGALVLVVGAVFVLAGAARLGIRQPVPLASGDGRLRHRTRGVRRGRSAEQVVRRLERHREHVPEVRPHHPRAPGDERLGARRWDSARSPCSIVLPRIARRSPAGLVVLFGGIAVSGALDLETAHGVDVVGHLPEGLPTPTLPDIPLSTWVALVPAAIGIVLVAYSEALGVAREFAAHHGYEIDPDQELIAHGGTNIVSGLLGGMIAGGGMSASAVKEGAGARSQVANFVAWGATIVTLFLLTPLFQSLPQAVLGALIIQAVWHLIVARKLQRLRVLARYEWVLGRHHARRASSSSECSPGW